MNDTLNMRSYSYYSKNDNMIINVKDRENLYQYFFDDKERLIQKVFKHSNNESDTLKFFYEEDSFIVKDVIRIVSNKELKIEEKIHSYQVSTDDIYPIYSRFEEKKIF